MKVKAISVLIGGEAGAGIARSGFLFAKTCLRGGLHVFGTNDYQSLIRGGHNFYIASIDDEKVYSQTYYIDLLIALNAEIVMLHKDKLVPAGGIIYARARRVFEKHQSNLDFFANLRFNNKRICHVA